MNSESDTILELAAALVQVSERLKLLRGTRRDESARCISIAITDLETASLWLKESVERDDRLDR